MALAASLTLAAACAKPKPPATPAPTSAPSATLTATLAPAPTATRPPATPAPSPTPAPTPAPSPTPTPEPCPIQKASKLGVGVYNFGGGNLKNALTRMKPGVILLSEPDVGFAKEVRQCFPKAFIVGRRFIKDQPLDNPEAHGTQIADFVAEKAVPLKGIVDAWMSYNEPIGNGDISAYQSYNRFQVAFARKLQDGHGIAAVAANDGASSIDPADYVKYFHEAISSSRYFGIHAYAPRGAKSLRDDADHFALRYRAINKALADAGIKHGPFVITEVGLWDGWRGQVGEDEMARQFIWLADEMEKDDYTVGFAIFGLFGNGQWKEFEMEDAGGMLDALAGYKGRTTP